MSPLGRMSARERRLLIITLIAAVICIPVVIGPLLGSQEATDEDPDAELAQIQSVLSRVERQLATNQNLREKLGNPDAEFISPSGVLELLVELEQVGKQADLKISSYAQGIREKAKPLPELTVQIDYTGRFQNVVKFLDALEKMKVPVYVRNLRMTLKDEGSGELTGNIKITSFLQEAPQHIGKEKATEKADENPAEAKSEVPA